MKKYFTLMKGVALSLLLQLIFIFNSSAQTDGLGLLFRVSIDGVNTDYKQGSCGYETATWGGTITEDFCAPVTWAYDINSDSLCCDSVPAGSLTGKIAMIRRGTCEFGAKSLSAEKGGALVALIANGYDASHGDACNAVPMGAGVVGDQVTIPALFICRNITDQIDNAMKAGKDVQICILLPRIYNATSVYQYATPLSQVDTIGDGIVSVYFKNRSTNTLNNVEVKADIISPSGSVQTLSQTIAVSAPAQEDTIDFPAFIPEAVMGKFKIQYTNSAFTEPLDTLVTYFEHTEHTFATDNLVIDPLGVGVSNADFISGNFIHQSAGLCVTGDAGGNATYVTFGIANVDSLWSPLGDDANTVGIIVYDADYNNDGILDIQNNFDDLAGQEVGIGNYIMNGQEGVDSLINVPVYDTNDPLLPVPLQANHAYYVSLFYDGANAGTGRCLRYSNTLDVPYAINLTTPLFVAGTLYSGYAGTKIIERLQLEGFDPLNAKEQKPLDLAKFKITPNPASDVVRLDLQLEGINKSVTVSLLDWNGRPVRTQTVKEFQNGQLVFNVNDLPSGYYLAWIRTSEGATMAKVAVCH